MHLITVPLLLQFDCYSCAWLDSDVCIPFLSMIVYGSAEWDSNDPFTHMCICDGTPVYAQG